VYIPKDEHSKRPLGLPALEDKIVQKGIARILEAIYEQDFLNCSYGFRPGRNCHQALDVVDKTIMKRPIHYVIEADIKGFFDSGLSHCRGGSMRPWIGLR
jgi:RNA-directed DNA polymerase